MISSHACLIDRTISHACPSPTVCLSLTYFLLCHMKPAAMPLTCSPQSTLLVFFIDYPLLHVSVCPLNLLLLPSPPLPHGPLLPAMTPQTSPPAASRPLPHFARRAPNECEAGIQGVCRCASLTGRAGATAGNARTRPGPNNSSMLC